MQQPETKTNAQSSEPTLEQGRRPYTAPEIRDFLHKPVVFGTNDPGERGSRRPSKTQ
jgi:hypothetical protein